MKLSYADARYDKFLVAYRIDHSKVLISYELIAFNQEIKIG